MTAAGIGVRPVRRGTARKLADALARAFYDDPPFLWMLPGDRTRLARTPGIFATVLLREALRHGRRLGPATELVAALAHVHPRSPHWYLYAIGVDPAHQGRGVGGALLRSRLDRVATEGGRDPAAARRGSGDDAHVRPGR